MPKETLKKELKTDVSDQILNLLGDLAKDVKNLTNRVDSIEKQPQISSPSVAIKESEIKVDETKFPIPREYREAVLTSLNQFFGLKIEPLADRPAFIMTLVVPDKYSSLTPEEKKIHKMDLRSKVISYAEGVNGVKAYAELVLSSFNPDVRTQISIDRSININDII